MAMSTPVVHVLLLAVAVIFTTAAAAHTPGQRERGFMRTVPRDLRRQLAVGRGTKKSDRGKKLLISGLTAGLAKSSGALLDEDPLTGLTPVVHSPLKFGGDPTGRVDSTTAVLAAVAACVNLTRLTPSTFSFGVRDAAGCMVDLEGGEYLISQPVVIPTFVSNMKVGGGSLVANPASTHWTSHARTPAAAQKLAHREAAAAHARAEASARFGLPAGAQPSTGVSADAIAALAAAGRGPAAARFACTGQYSVNETGRWCQGLTSAPASASASADACAAACCAMGTPGDPQRQACVTWQYCPAGAPCSAPARGWGSCWVSIAAPKCSAPTKSAPERLGWVGASRAKVPSPPLPPAPPQPFANFMIEIGGTEACTNPQGSCNEDIGLPGLFLDGSNVAAGVVVTAVMGTTIGPTSYFLNFSAHGILVKGGHECMIQETWLGETNFDFRFNKTTNTYPTATGIEIDGNDHYISDSIIFSAYIGLNNRGAANYAGGLHVWFPWNAARAFDAFAFLELGGQNRYEGCYIDGSQMLISGNGMVTWQDGFALGGGIMIQGPDVMNVVITDTEFRGGTIFAPNNVTGNYTSVTNTIIKNNEFTRGIRGSTATRTRTSTTPQTSWFFDFCAELVFPNIVTVRHSFTSSSAGDFPVAVARQPTGCQVVIETNPAAAGTMVVDVDTSAYA